MGVCMRELVGGVSMGSGVFCGWVVGLWGRGLGGWLEWGDGGESES